MYNTNQRNQTHMCRRCSTSHMPRQCPAWGKVCGKCGLANHFAVSCRSNRCKIQSLEEDVVGEFVRLNPDIEQPSTSYVISSIGHGESWHQEFKFNQVSVNFKLDSGADLNVLPLDVVKKIDPTMKLQNSNNVNVTAYGNFKLPVLGKIVLKLKVKNVTHKVEFVVMKNSKGIIPILGRETCEKLNLIKRMSRNPICLSQIS
uniref:Peptidase A2 domain-containing protein n=1 Tax=Cacopsylla melanoneura TaxID=428564 RepID=A0A8D8V6Z5_9HEMI